MTDTAKPELTEEQETEAREILDCIPLIGLHNQTTGAAWGVVTVDLLLKHLRTLGATLIEYIARNDATYSENETLKARIRETDDQLRAVGQLARRMGLIK